MDVVNQLIEQAKNFFASMTPGARLTAGLLLAVVVVSVAFLFKQSTAGPDEYLFGAEPLSASQLVAVETAIGKAGLADYHVDRNRVRVPAGQKHLYIAAVADAGALPRSVQDVMQRALEETSVMESREVKAARLKAAREAQLSQIITDMPWVTQASVLYAEEGVRGLRSRKNVSATVSVRPLAGEMVDPRRTRNLQRLVAGWHPSLSMDSVTVIDQSDNSASVAGGAGDPDDFEHPYHKTLVAFENRTRNAILRQLRDIPGVRVEVSATLDPTLASNSVSVKPEKDPLRRTEREQREVSDRNTTDGALRPGLEIQGPRGNGDEGPRRTNQLKTEKTDNLTESQFPDTRTVLQTAGLVPKEVQASVSIPRSYVIDVWKSRKQIEEGQVPDTIDTQQLELVKSDVIRDVQNIVEPLLTDPANGEDEFKKVHVVVVDTVDAPPLPTPSAASTAWLFASRHANTAALLAVGLVGLLMLRSVVRGGSPGAPAPGVPSLRLDADDSGPGAAGDSDGDDDTKPKLKLKKPESLKDDLADIVREDPDAAAAILRGWIGQAS